MCYFKNDWCFLCIWGNRIYIRKYIFKQILIEETRFTDKLFLLRFCLYLWDITHHFGIDFLLLYDETITVFSKRDMKSPVKSCSNRNRSSVCTWSIGIIIWNYLIISFDRIEYYSIMFVIRYLIKNIHENQKVLFNIYTLFINYFNIYFL